jgi:nitroreductase
MTPTCDISRLTTANLLNAIYDRRAVRKYTADVVERGDLERLIAIAIQAPSAMNLQPWAFVVIQGEKRLREYSERAKTHLLQGAGQLADHARLLDEHVNIFHDASTLVIICATADEEQAQEDCCLAAQTFMLAAFGAGYATCPIGFSRPWFRLSETKRELGIPQELVPVFPVIIGIPAEHPQPHGRNPARILWL